MDVTESEKFLRDNIYEEFMRHTGCYECDNSLTVSDNGKLCFKKKYCKNYDKSLD